jgi:hypothetical protein
MENAKNTYKPIAPYSYLEPKKCQKVLIIFGSYSEPGLEKRSAHTHTRRSNATTPSRILINSLKTYVLQPENGKLFLFSATSNDKTCANQSTHEKFRTKCFSNQN